MAFLDLILCLLVSAVAFGLGSSHVGVATGPAVGSGAMSRKSAIVVSSIGYVVGLALGMNLQFITGISDAVCVLSISSAFMIFSAVTGIPLSLTYVVASSNAGCFFSHSHPLLPILKILELLAWWFIATGLAIALGILFGYLLKFWTSKPSTKVIVSKLLSITLSFLVAACIGFNNLAYLSYLTEHRYPLYIALASVIGALVFGYSSITIIGHKIYGPRFSNALAALITVVIVTTVATELRVPISISYLTVAALLGASLSTKPRLIMYNVASRLMLVQLLSVPLALAISIGVSMVI